MPSIASRTISNVESEVRHDLGIPKDISQFHVGRPPIPPLQPIRNPVLRTPLPNLVVTAPDSLRQYYAGGQIPQYRFSPVKPLGQ